MLLVKLTKRGVVKISKVFYLGKCHKQCDQIRRFLKVLHDKFSCKSGPNIL